MLPDIDGLEVCRRIRAPSSDTVPVLMLTARGDADGPHRRPRARRRRLPAQAVRAARAAGAHPRHAAPARAARRRRPTTCCASAASRSTATRARVAVDGEPARPHLLPVRPAGRAGRARRPRAVARPDHGRACKGDELEAFDRSIDVHIARIRAAIEDDPKNPRAHPHRARRRLRVRASSRTTAADAPAVPACLLRASWRRSSCSRSWLALVWHSRERRRAGPGAPEGAAGDAGRRDVPVGADAAREQARRSGLARTCACRSRLSEPGDGASIVPGGGTASVPGRARRTWRMAARGGPRGRLAPPRRPRLRGAPGRGASATRSVAC